MSDNMFRYVLPAKGSPYGRIEPFSAPIQAGTNTPSATAIPGNLAPPPALGVTTPAPPVAQHSAQQNGIRWGQLGKGAGQAALGGAGAVGGAALIDTGIGAPLGGLAMAMSASDMGQGLSRAWDALHGVPSQGTNILKDPLARHVPHGASIYDGLALGLTGYGALKNAPLLVDPAVTGINRMESIFGAKVRGWDNSYKVPGTNILLDSTGHRGKILSQGAAKGAQTIADWNDD